MYHYEYVHEDEWKPIKKELNAIINQVKNDLRDTFTFQFKFVGSTARNMITNDYSQTGFDFDVNIEVNDPDNDFAAKEIKQKLINAFNSIINPYHNSIFKSGYDYCEDSTRVFTIKVKDRYKSKVLYSADFCIVNNYTDKHEELCQQYIRFNKGKNEYSWAEQSKSFVGLDNKISEIKKLQNSKYWNEVRERYIYKKNTNNDPDKKSRSLFAEAVKEVWDTIR